MKIVLKIQGMHCQNCVNAVTKALKQVPGVLEAQVTLEDSLATVVYEGEEEIGTALLEAVDEIGFEGERQKS